MSKSTIIIDGAGVSVTLNSVAIADIVSLSFSVFGEREKIDLTTIDATKWKATLLGDLQKIEDITITKKSNPTDDLALYSTSSQALVINYKIGKSTAKVLTYYAQLKSISQSSVARSNGDGVNVDLAFFITNLSSLTETGPAITAGA